MTGLAPQGTRVLEYQLDHQWKEKVADHFTRGNTHFRITGGLTNLSDGSKRNGRQYCACRVLTGSFYATGRYFGRKQNALVENRPMSLLHSAPFPDVSSPDPEETPSQATLLNNLWPESAQ
jgi:hypothetical protein